MSTDEIKARAEETMESAKGLVEAGEKAVDARLSKDVPDLARLLEEHLDRASKGLADALQTIERGTTKEQRKLLKTYGSFLHKQAKIVDKKIASPKGKKGKKAKRKK
jgi:hypothetical protein